MELIAQFRLNHVHVDKSLFHFPRMFVDIQDFVVIIGELMELIVFHIRCAENQSER